MAVPIEHIRLSQQARGQLVKMKRTTGIACDLSVSSWMFPFPVETRAEKRKGGVCRLNVIIS